MKIHYRNYISLLSIALLLLGCAVKTAAQNNCTTVDRVRIQLQWVLQAQFAGMMLIYRDQV